MLARRDFGAEEFTADDRAYEGSRFSEVRDAIFANPYQEVWPGPVARLPTYKVALSDVLRGVLTFGRRFVFQQATARAVDSHADLRWGSDRRGFRRLLHPNGICLTGLWRITEATAWSGYFRAGSEALVVARYSTCCSETRRGHTRSLALAGKLYPTADPEHPHPLRTASFITQQDIAGEDTDYINDAQLRNAPDVHFWRRGSGVPVLLVTGVVFGRVDRQPTQRQLYQIAELGKADGQPTRSPRYMRLSIVAEQPRIAGNELDFRDEVMAQIFDPGDPVPRRTLAFDIDVSDEAVSHGPALVRRVTVSGWQRIGKLVFDNAVASYNGDFVLHFNHPTWREDPNTPGTATRVDGRKV
jgi:hypothetical protein